MQKIAATLTYSVQISYDDYVLRRVTKVFLTDAPVKAILDWANIYVNGATIDCIDFGEFKEGGQE